MNEIAVDAGVRPASLGSWRARTAKVTATSDWPVSFCHGLQPEAALVADLGGVVGEPDQAEARS